MMNLLAVALGGTLGSMLRYLAVSAMNDRFGVGFPWGTLSVNVVGSFLIGVVAILFQQRYQGERDAFIRSLFMVGLLGGFTTFSAFSLETIQLLGSGLMLKAIVNIVGNVVICLIATGLGFLSGHWLNQFLS